MGGYPGGQWMGSSSHYRNATQPPPHGGSGVSGMGMQQQQQQHVGRHDPLPPRQQQQQQQAPAVDLSELKAMFPSMDEAILQEVVASKQGNVEAAIDALLAMC